MQYVERAYRSENRNPPYRSENRNPRSPRCEQIELVEPRKAVEEAGARTELISIEPGEVQAVNHDIEPADKLTVDRLVSEASVDDYDALILPGGAVNPDTLRTDEDAVGFVRAFVQSGKPVGVICTVPGRPERGSPTSCVIAGSPRTRACGRTSEASSWTRRSSKNSPVNRATVQD